MPGHYVHMAAAERIARSLRDLKTWPTYVNDNLAGMTPAQLADIVAMSPNYYALGAVGPDLFFFLPDFRQPHLATALVGVLDFLDGLYKALDEWVLTRWERYFGPISEDTSELVSRLTGDLPTVVGDITSSLSSVLVTALMDLASQSKDWFGEFSLGANRGYDNQDFLWSDMLHYRKTGQFGRALWVGAQIREDNPMDGETVDQARAAADKLRAYALGYITHIGTDVTGHPFVNEKSGGPYRTHWQRHHLVENHMDARQYDVDHSGDASYTMITESALHFRLLFGDDEMRTLPPTLPGSATLRGRYERKRLLDADSELPDDLAQLLFDAMGTAYAPRSGPDDSIPGGIAFSQPTETTPKILPTDDGRPSTKTIQETFALVFRYLRYVTVDGLGHDKPAPPQVFPNLDFPIFTDPHDSAPGAADPPMDFLDVLLAIIRVLLFIPAVVIWLATVLPAAIADLGTYGPRVLAYYTVELPLYYLVKAARQILVMTGFTLPMKDEIDAGLVTLGIGSRDLFLVNLGSMDDVFGGLDVASIAPLLQRVDQLMMDEALTREQALARALAERGIRSGPPFEPVGLANDFPKSIPEDTAGQANEFQHPWLYPMSPVEQPPTFSSPHQFGEESPLLLTGSNLGEQAGRSQYENARGPEDTARMARTHGGALGDPINFGTYLIWQITRAEPPAGDSSSLTDWNLDSDRGYAWKCWDWDRCGDRPVSTDQTGHKYLTPKSATPQLGSDGRINPSYDPTSDPLSVHYTDQPDRERPLKCEDRRSRPEADLLPARPPRGKAGDGR